MGLASRGRRVRGLVERRGPDRISGWAWRAGERPLDVCFSVDGEVIGESRADGRRPDLSRQGFGDGRVGFTWKIPKRDPPIEPAAVRVTDKASGAVIADRPGLRPLSRSSIRGQVESRGPEAIAGWAWGPDGPVTLHLIYGRRRIGACAADRPRSDLLEAGIADGRGGFFWRLPAGDALDPAKVRVVEAATGAVLADAPGLKAVRPPAVWGFVEARGPESIVGWAWGPDGALGLRFIQDGEVIGEAVADLPRPNLAELGFGDGHAGFEWRLPYRDPPVDPARVEVRVGAPGRPLPDVGGLRAVPSPAVRGVVEARGPETISGWAWTAAGRARLIFLRGGERLGECVAEELRAGLAELGVGDGRVGFSWRLPFLDPPLDPVQVEVRAEPGEGRLPDAADVKIAPPRMVRGVVEARGPSVIAGWAKGPSGPVEIEFRHAGELLGACTADIYREGLQEAGVGDGRAGFEWSIPPADTTIDPATIEVRARASGETLADAEGLRPNPPPAVRGAVDARGPEFIAGWARGRHGPVDVEFVREGQVLGRVTADRLRQEVAGRPGFGDGCVGFAWRLPFLDPPFDPRDVEVREAATGVPLADAAGLEALVAPPVRGVVEERGPGFVSGWARAAGGPVTLQFVLDGERLGEVRAEQFRQDLADTGVGDGCAAFRWRLPFRDPPVDVARIEVREQASGALIGDAPGLRPVRPRVVRGRVEVRGPEVISGWARDAEGPVSLHVMVGEEVLDEIVSDRFRQGLLDEGVGDGRAAFAWTLPFTDPPIDPAAVRLVEARRGLEIPDAPGLEPVRPPVIRGMVEERSYRLVSGWARSGRPEARVELEILQDGEVIGTCTADRLRRDLRRAAGDDGRHGFSWTPPRGLRGFDASRVQVRARTGGVILPEKPRTPRPTGLEVAALRIEAGWLVGRLALAGDAPPPKAIDLVLDDRFLLRADIGALAFDKAGGAELEVELPRQVFDGASHRLTLHEPREGHLIGGQERPLVLQSAFNSSVELLTGREIRGWVIDPEDPDGQGRVELWEGDRLIRAAGFTRERPEVAKAMGAAHAWEFAMRRLPLDLFDGEEHLLSLTSAGRPLFAHQRRRMSVCWTPEEAAEGSERYDGAVQEITPLTVRGYVLDHLSDRPLQLEIRVDGQIVATPMADRYVAALKARDGHGFHGFDFDLPSSLMNGRSRRLEVRPAGSRYALPPGVKRLTFPLVAVGEPPRPLAPPQLAWAGAAASGEPALLSLIVLNLDGAHVLEPFLRSLEATGFRDPVEVILVDHGSSDESRDIIEAWRTRLPLTPIFRGGNHSFSASNNLGALLARGEHLVFVNNDIVFTGDALAGMRDILDAKPEVGLVGLRLLEPRYRGGGRWEDATHHTGVRFRALISQDKSRPRTYHPTEVEDGGDRGAVVEPAVTAALAMVRKRDFRAVGGFEEAYHYGYEDVDLALRLRGRLGKSAVCRLDVTAIHNRSATREAKLVPTGQQKPVAISRLAAHANLDIFTRRFSRHLPRLILRQLVEGGEAWRPAPLRICFVVGDPGAGADAEAARALGEEVRRRFGWEPMLLAEDGRELAQTDVLVCTRPGFELRRVGDAAPGLVTVAWPLTGPQAWDGRAVPYQLTLALMGAPARAAGELRAALLDLLAGPRRRIAVKAQAENEPRAHALAAALAARGHLVRLDGPRHWMDGLSACDELVVAMAGVKAYAPFNGAVNALCLVPGADRPSADALESFDRVFEAGEPEADAAALIEMHERLRREFLGRLAD